MPKTYKVTMPVTLNVEIEANHAESVEHVLRQLFNPDAPNDPMEGVKIALPLLMPFAVSGEMVIKTCTLDSLDEIDISEA